MLIYPACYRVISESICILVFRRYYCGRFKKRHNALKFHNLQIIEVDRMFLFQINVEMDHKLLIVCDHVVDKIPPEIAWHDLRQNLSTVINLIRNDNSNIRMALPHILPYIHWLVSRVVDVINTNMSSDVAEANAHRVPENNPDRNDLELLIKGMRNDVFELKGKLVVFLTAIKHMLKHSDKRGEVEPGFMRVWHLHNLMIKINFIIGRSEIKLKKATAIINTPNKKTGYPVKFLRVLFIVMVAFCECGRKYYY